MRRKLIVRSDGLCVAPCCSSIRQAFPDDTGSVSYLRLLVQDSSAHRMRSSLASEGIALYYAQLALNLLWTPLFFVQKQVCAVPSQIHIKYLLTVIRSDKTRAR